MDPTINPDTAYAALFGENGEANRLEHGDTAATKIQKHVRGTSERTLAKIESIQRERRSRRETKGKRGITFHRAVWADGEAGPRAGAKVGRNLTKGKLYQEGRAPRYGSERTSTKQNSLRWTANTERADNIYDVCEASGTTLPASSFPHLADRITPNTPFQVLEVKANGKHVIARKVFQSEGDELETKALDRELQALKTVDTMDALRRSSEIKFELLGLERIEISEVDFTEIGGMICEMETKEAGSSQSLFQAEAKAEPGLFPALDELYDTFSVDLPDVYLADSTSVATDKRAPPLLAFEKYTDPATGNQKARTVVIVGKTKSRFGGSMYSVLKEDATGKKYLRSMSSGQLKKYNKKAFKKGPKGKDFSTYLKSSSHLKVGIDYLTRKESDYKDIKEYRKLSFGRGNSTDNFSERFFEAQRGSLAAKFDPGMLETMLEGGGHHTYSKKYAESVRLTGAYVARTRAAKYADGNVATFSLPTGEPAELKSALKNPSNRKTSAYDEAAAIPAYAAGAGHVPKSLDKIAEEANAKIKSDQQSRAFEELAGKRMSWESKGDFSESDGLSDEGY